MFAGFNAERRFRVELGYPTTAPDEWFRQSLDGYDLRRLASEISFAYLSNRNVPETYLPPLTLKSYTTISGECSIVREANAYRTQRFPANVPVTECYFCVFRLQFWLS